MTAVIGLTAIATAIAVELRGFAPEEVDAIVGAWRGCDAEVLPQAPDGVELIRLRIGTAHTTGAAKDPWLVAPDFASAHELLAGEITRRAIEARSSDHLLIHAAAVADPTSGRTVVLVGPSGRGKTTAAIALGEDFDYVTDECVAIADDLSIVPYRKPLSVLRPSEAGAVPTRPKLQVPAAELGLRDAAGSRLRIAAIVYLDRFTDDADGGVQGSPAIEDERLVDALGELVPQISALAARDRPLTRLARVVEACGGLKRIGYSEASSLRALIRGLLDAEPSDRPTAADTAAELAGHEAGASLPDGITAPTHDEHGVSALPVEDMLDVGDAIAVLKEGVVTVLAGAGPEILRVASRGSAGIDELTARLVALHGLPDAEDPSELVRVAVDELIDAGLLTRQPAAPATGPEYAGAIDAKH